MTHINAYLVEVAEKQKVVDEAKNALKVAEDALKAHSDYKAPVKEEVKEPEAKERDSKGHFLKK